MKLAAVAPFLDYTAYKNFKKAEGRHYVTLVDLTTKKHTQMSFARYLLCIREGRFLTGDEEADHIDGNKANDAIENLQILSRRDNLAKSVIERDVQAEIETRVCPYCLISFSRPARYFRTRDSRGQRAYCSRTCSGADSINFRKWRPRVSSLREPSR